MLRATKERKTWSDIRALREATQRKRRERNAFIVFVFFLFQEPFGGVSQFGTSVYLYININPMVSITGIFFSSLYMALLVLFPFFSKMKGAMEALQLLYIVTSRKRCFLDCGSCVCQLKIFSIISSKNTQGKIEKNRKRSQYYTLTSQEVRAFVVTAPAAYSSGRFNARHICVCLQIMHLMSQAVSVLFNPDC